MKRILILILTAALLFAGLSLPAPGAADGDHPITLSITCDPVPELEGAGTIPDLKFTIRNNSASDYTLSNAKLSGGYENDTRVLPEEITIIAGGTKEFDLFNVPVAEDQLGIEITYLLEWEEHETVIDEVTGDAQFLKHARETTASFRIDRFMIPELSVSAACDNPYVRANEKFKVTYTIRNDTAFDMTGLKLYDPEQSTEPIKLPQDELTAGDSITVDVTYRMGSADMTFEPRIEYIARHREMQTRAAEVLTVESIVVDLTITAEMRQPTAEGTTFAVTVRNNGNRAVTDICVFDEINTQIAEPFSLGAEEYRTLLYTVMPAVSSDRVRSVRFHLTAVDNLRSTVTVEDPDVYEVVPYIMPDSVELKLYAVLQSPYYDKDGKLCASIQFIISNNSNVKIYRASLRELSLFGEVTSYEELRHGDTYYTQIYQLDGVTELRFRVDAYDPAGAVCTSDTIRLDLSGLKELADRKNDPVYVQTQNVYLKDLDSKYTGVLRIVLIIGLAVAAVCAIACIVLYTVEIRLRNKLPGEFEEDMDRALNVTKRRTEKQLFSDAPTEQFGYTAPIKLRNYGELTEEEAKARRELYARGLAETLRKEGVQQPPKAEPASQPTRIDVDGTRVMPVVRRHPATEIPVQGAAPIPAPAVPPIAPDPIPEPEMIRIRRPKTEPVIAPEPEPVIAPEPEPVIAPEPEPIHIRESEPVIAPEPEPIHIREPEPVIAPEPVVVSAPEPEPVIAPEPIEGTEFAVPAEPTQNVRVPRPAGPKKLFEKPTPAKRPFVWHPVRRISG